MSPKSILQFLAVCGSAKVVEAFATAPAKFGGGSVKVEVEQESSQIGGNTRCPCYNDPNCAFRGVGAILDPTDADIVTKTNDCWEKCYKDPIRGNGATATDWAKCEGGAQQWRADACSETYALDRAVAATYGVDSVFYTGGADMCKIDDAASNQGLCTELKAMTNPYAIMYGKSCQQTFEESAPDSNRKGYCESLHYVVDNGFQNAYRCAHSKNNNGKHLCRPSKGLDGSVIMTPICYNVTYRQVHGFGSDAPNNYGCVAGRDCVLGADFIRKPFYLRAAQSIWG